MTDPRIPSKQDTRRLIEEDGLPQIQTDLLIDTVHEYRALRAILDHDPRKRTPAAIARLDELARDVLKQADLIRTRTGAKTYEFRGLVFRSPTHQRDMLRVLVSTGLWDAMGAKIKAELAGEAGASGSDSAAPARPSRVTRKRADHRDGNHNTEKE